MAGKIRLVKSGGTVFQKHYFLVYSPSGSFADTNDMLVLSSHWRTGIDGKKYMTLDVQEFNDAIDTNEYLTKNGPLDWSNEYYADMTFPDMTAEEALDTFTAMRDSYGSADSDGVVSTNILYNLEKSNSTSAISTFHEATGNHMGDFVPKLGGNGATSVGMRGEDTYIDYDDPNNGNNGDQSWTIESGRHVDYIPYGGAGESGTDTITVAEGGSITIKPISPSGDNNNDVIFEVSDSSQVKLHWHGSNLEVIDLSGPNGWKVIGTLEDYEDNPQASITVDDGTNSVELNLQDHLISGVDILADWISDVWDIIVAAYTTPSPLVMDIDGDGVELVSLSSANAVYWDGDVDGFAEASGWVGSDDGLLAVDLNADGIINNSGELFGDQTGYANGFLALAQYDSNADGLITNADANWGDLIVWIDADANGYSESTEQHTLDSLSITQIDLGYSDVSYQIAGNDVLQESTFTIDGNTRDIVDAYFAADSVNTVYDTSYTVDMGAFMLPSHRGYGTLPDLHIAMSLDNTGTGNLLDLVSDFAELSFDDIFTEDSTVMDDVRDIMYRWAGVDNLNGDERGSNIDSRELGFLEKLSGQDFLQLGHWENPFAFAAQELQEAFDIAQQNIFARLVAQSAGGDLFTGDWYYDIASDSIQGVTGLDSTVLSAIETEASSATYPEILWGNVVRMIENTVGTSNLPTADQTALDTAITNSSASLDLQDILDSLLWGAPDGTTYTGTSGDDSLTGGSGYDTLNGGYGNDTLHGGIGNDDLRGDADDDALYGDTGNDYITGGTGNDTYYYDLGDGEDVYKENGTGTGNADEIVLGSGIDSGDLTITRAGNTDLMIEIDTGTATGLIVIENQFNYSTGGGHIETIRFSDNSTYNLAAQDYTLTGTSGNDTLYGSRYASTGVDTIYGGAGNDTIYGNAPNEGDTAADTLYGEAGNDTLKGSGGNDTLYGGTGDDTLYGGSGDDDLSGDAGDDELHDVSGDDTYHYLGGNDTIYDGNGTDEILLDATWNSVTPSYYKIGNDLQIYWDADNSITIDKFFTTGEVETMVFADTTSVTLGSVSYVVQGTDGNDSITGTTGDDLFYGFAGDDTLNGSLGSNGDDTLFGGTGDDALNGGYGDDYLDGGAGDDTMKGGADNDHYIYASGDDWIRDLSGTDVLELVSGWTIDDITLSRYDTAAKNLVIEINGTNSITVEK